MNLKLALAVSGGIITIVAASSYMLLSSGEVDPEMVPDESLSMSYGEVIDPLEPDVNLPPPQDPEPIRVPDQPGKVMMVIPEGSGGSYEEITAKYKGHFDDHVNWFISTSGLSIPRQGARWELYNAWKRKAGELRQRFRDDFGVEVVDSQVTHGSIGGVLRRTIFDVCSGKEYDRKLRYCMVDEGKYGDSD